MTKASKARAQADELLTAVSGHSKAHGEPLVEGISDAALLLLNWLSYLQLNKKTGTANELLVATHSAVLEVAAYLSLGLGRAALFALRAQVDVLLAWLYFKDHPVEWKTAHEKGEGRLRADVINYLKNHVDGFDERKKDLEKRKKRTRAEPYNILSLHAHSQIGGAMPSAARLADLVSNRQLCDDCAALQFDVSEYLNDVLLATFVGDWHALPKAVTADAEARLGRPKLKELASL